jgi:hypothetical protein
MHFLIIEDGLALTRRRIRLQRDSHPVIEEGS